MMIIKQTKLHFLVNYGCFKDVYQHLGTGPPCSILSILFKIFLLVLKG